MSETRSIGGHAIDLRGICVGEACQAFSRRLADLIGIASLKESVGELGLAHVGALNEREQAEFEAEKERIWSVGP